jgi:hypothetical protein
MKINESETVKAYNELKPIFSNENINVTNSFDCSYNEKYNHLAVFVILKEDLSPENIINVAKIASKHECEAILRRYSKPSEPNEAAIEIRRIRGREELIEQDGIKYDESASTGQKVFSFADWKDYYESINTADL